MKNYRNGIWLTRLEFRNCVIVKKGGKYGAGAKEEYSPAEASDLLARERFDWRCEKRAKSLTAMEPMENSVM